MRYDIKYLCNVIGGRQGWAYVCNSHEIPVLKADMVAGKTEFDNYYKFNTVNVKYTRKGYNGRNDEIRIKDGTLVCDEGKWKITSAGCCISASFTYHDAMKMVENANAPIIEVGKVVAIAKCTEMQISLELFKVGKVDSQCVVVCDLIPLDNDEMQSIVDDIYKWLRRF